MNKIDIVKTAFSFKTPPEQAREYLTDDFQATDSVGGPPTDVDAWFGMGAMMQHSIPDIDYVIDEIRHEGDDVIFVGRFTGIFTNDLDLSAMNMGVIPATGKALNFSPSTSRVSFDGHKICRSHSLDTGPNAGMGGILAALGAG